MTSNSSASRATTLASSELMLRDIAAEGINTENVCLYDVAALKFKFNEIEAQTKKLLQSSPDDECYEIEDALGLLRRTVRHCLDQVRMDHSVGFAIGEPIAASTPARNETSTFHTAKQSMISSRNRSNLPKITLTMANKSYRPNATYDVSNDGFKPNLTFSMTQGRSGDVNLQDAPSAGRPLNETFKASSGDPRFDDEFSYIKALYNTVAAEVQSHSI